MAQDKVASSSNEHVRAEDLKVQLLEESFAKVSLRADGFVKSFYHNLFVDFPDLEPLFAGTNMERQNEKLLTSLVFIIDNLKHPGSLVGVLGSLGARHVKYGARPEHYPAIGSSLIKTFSEYLGEDWTCDTEQAWIEAYNLIAEAMLDGSDYSVEAIQLEEESQVKEDKERNTKPLIFEGILGGFIAILVALLLLL